MRNETTPEEYWAQMAQEVGEPILEYSLVRLAIREEGERSGFFETKPDWGLVFLTETTLYVDRGSSPNWLQRLMTSRRPAEDPPRLCIPLSSVARLVMPKQLSWWKLLVKGPEMTARLETSVNPSVMDLTLDRRGPKDLSLLNRLAELVPAGAKNQHESAT